MGKDTLPRNIWHLFMRSCILQSRVIIRPKMDKLMHLKHSVSHLMSRRANTVVNSVYGLAVECLREPIPTAVSVRVHPES